MQLDRKSTHLPECLLILKSPIWIFFGGPNSLSHGSGPRCFILHSHLTWKATRGKYFWHSFSSERGKRSVRCHIPDIRETVDNTLQRVSSGVFRKYYRTHAFFQYREGEALMQRNLQCTDDDNRSYRNVCNMSFVSFSLAVIFIIREGEDT